MRKGFFAASAALLVSAVLGGCEDRVVFNEAKVARDQAAAVSVAHRNFFPAKKDDFCNGPYTLTASSTIEDCGGIVEVRHGTFAGATEYYLIREVRDGWKPVPYRIDAGKLMEVDSTVLDGCFDSRYAQGETCTFHDRFTSRTYTVGRAVNTKWKEILDAQFGGERVLANT